MSECNVDIVLWTFKYLSISNIDIFCQTKDIKNLSLRQQDLNNYEYFKLLNMHILETLQLLNSSKWYTGCILWRVMSTNSTINMLDTERFWANACICNPTSSPSTSGHASCPRSNGHILHSVFVRPYFHFKDILTTSIQTFFCLPRLWYGAVLVYCCIFFLFFMTICVYLYVLGRLTRFWTT